MTARMRFPGRRAALARLRSLDPAEPGPALASRLRSKLMVNTLFVVLTGRPPSPDERDAFIRRARRGAAFDELLAEVAGTEDAVDRTLGRIRQDLQARLRWDFESERAGGPEHPRPRVVFMHIMKTGGTSLSQLCSEWLPANRSRVHLFVDDLVLLPPAMLARLSFMAGHIPHEALEVIPGPYRTVIVLREPVARAVSHFLALRNSGPPYDQLTLDEFVSADSYRIASGNYQARQLTHRIGIRDAWVSYSPIERLSALTGEALNIEYPVQALFDSTPASIDEDLLLDAARRHLESIDFVGVTDQIDALAARVAPIFGGPSVEVPRLNVTPPFDRSQLTEPIRKKLEASTAVDREIYELAARRPVPTA